VQKVFRYLEPIRRNLQVLQTDGQTDKRTDGDILAPNAALHYVAWQRNY